MLQQFLFLMLASNAVLSTYDECTSHVQRYSMLALYAQNKKLTEGFLLAIYAEVLAECVRACSQKANCKATNYKRATSKHESNCELLSSSPDSKEILQAVTGWTVYKHLTEDVIPACMTSDHSAPCSPGYSCEESCSLGGPGYKCVDIDECLSKPCKNGGACINIVNMYSCECVPGYTGVNCETDIDECASNPCVYGSCNNHENSYSCNCNFGWGGPRCDKLFGIGKRK